MRLRWARQRACVGVVLWRGCPAQGGAHPFLRLGHKGESCERGAGWDRRSRLRHGGVVAAGLRQITYPGRIWRISRRCRSGGIRRVESPSGTASPVAYRTPSATFATVWSYRCALARQQGLAGRAGCLGRVNLRLIGAARPRAAMYAPPLVHRSCPRSQGHRSSLCAMSYIADMWMTIDPAVLGPCRRAART
jgi:hypothetical protein